MSGGHGAPDFISDRGTRRTNVPAPKPAPIPPPPYEGRHLIAELHGCPAAVLGDEARVERALKDAAAAARATLLEVRLHAFGPGHGVTGVALLAESHISIHTWPEHGYAAVDIFLCAPRHDLEAALTVLGETLQAERVEQQLIARGYAAQADFASHPA